MDQHYVSPTALSLFRSCRRCFWLDRNKKIKRPRGAFPTLPGGIDRVLKVYFDQHRSEGTLPEEIVEALPDGGEGTHLYSDMVKLKSMRNALKPTLTTIIGNVKLVGGIDDLLVDAEGKVSPFDYKTKGSPINDDADPFLYYRMQINHYGLLLSESGIVITGRGYLGYWSPLNVIIGENSSFYNDVTGLWMKCQVFSMDIDLQSARDEVIAAGVCLDGQLPESSKECEMCEFILKRESFIRDYPSWRIGK